MKQIKLSQGEFAIVDNKNFEWLSQWKWNARWAKHTKSFYAIRGKRIDSKFYEISMAREILGLKKDDKRQADHINHNTLDNRERNLRIVTSQQNTFNRKNIKGYTWNKIRRKYQARISMCGRSLSLGYFDTAKEAHNAYLKAKEKYHKIQRHTI